MKRKKIEKEIEMDYFSMLSDDIIGCILSRLTMAEAARSSVLSIRWRYLWSYNVSLDFDGSYDLYQLKQFRSHSNSENQELFYKERERFRRWVDQVLNSLRTQTVESLRIRSDLGNDSHVDNWVRFAIEKNVKKLDLNLFHYIYNSAHCECCVVPSLLNLSTLQVLRLSLVYVSGEDLEHLLSSCPLLETLAVGSSESLKSLRVCSHSKLKQLEITRCFNLKTLDISAQNLASFAYDNGNGLLTSINYKHIPNLDEVYFGGLHGDLVFKNFFRLTTYDHSLYLKVLKLFMISYDWYKLKIQLPKNLVLATLHHLELFYILIKDDTYNFFVSLMNRCPSLRTLTIKIEYHWWRKSHTFGINQELANAYNCVEEVKVIGFRGEGAEMKFIEYIIKNVPNLKKLIIDPILPYHLGVTFENKIRETNDYSFARTRARNIEPNIPPYVEFVIL